MVNFHICWPGHGCLAKRQDSQEYEIGTRITWSGLFTFVDEPATHLNVQFA